MKIQCNACEVAEAVILCCADEAALCRDCDQKVHAANKLASKHQRVLLTNSANQMPKCDICQETFGYFFCLEDRALLCRKCDVAIHTANSLVSAHNRFLLTGVKVGLEATEPGPSVSLGKSLCNEKTSETERRTTPAASTGQYVKALPLQTNGGEGFVWSKLSTAGGSATEVSQWQLDDFIGFGDYTQNYNFMDNVSSKADSGKQGSDRSSSFQPAVGDLDDDECLGQAPDSFFMVPQVHSPPTLSGLSWSKNYRNPSDSAVFVPDVSSSPLRSFQHYPQLHSTNSKRRRQF
ncbi:B-box zinc finger protein 22-like [Olea europaea var. sylvestris]|uniref:B-box zinc finger protein 22-like n=1 Tax=Olea europaea var. sylvestris TaxID=158386 RepID=UPI000C1D19F9|nr:B-box zinc finger protein 22-like [Olea europaea var. sylvestris]